jgi:integrase
VPQRPTLSDNAVRNLRPPKQGTVTLWDALTGFGVRCSSGGAKSFIVLVGSGQRRAIGRYPIISLAEARSEAKRILAEKTLGKDKLPTVLVADALTLFLADAAQRNKPRTVRDYTRLLNRHLAKLTRRSVGDISTREVAHLLDKLRDTPSEASHALIAIKVFFNWCLRRGYIPANPCAHLIPTKSPSRSRVLTDGELARVYKTAVETSHPFGAIVQLLILTGQRRSEIGLLQWDWIDEKNRTITLPAEVTKNNRQHSFPYGDMVVAILKQTPRMGDYVFRATREHTKGMPVATVNGWSNSKVAFDLRVQGKAAKSPVAHWTLHDLRRTFATNMASLNVPPHITEKLLNHVSGTISGVAAIYNRHAYQEEMRAAMQLWENKLTSLLGR